MLSLENLELTVDGEKIFSGLSAKFAPTTITFLQGHNGSGKTSLLRMLAGIQKPSVGKITFGEENVSISDLNRPYALYIGHHTGLKLELSVLDNVLSWARFYGSEETVDPALHYFSLHELAGAKCYELSAGNRQKVALARLLACHSHIWLLDEVDQNLDSNNRDLLDKLIVSKADTGGIIIMTTHTKPRIESGKILNMSEYE